MPLHSHDDSASGTPLPDATRRRALTALGTAAAGAVADCLRDGDVTTTDSRGTDPPRNPRLSGPVFTLRTSFHPVISRSLSSIVNPNMSEFTDPAVGHSADAQAYQFLDNIAYVRVSGAETDGRTSVVEMHQPEGHVTPQHVHEETDETLHVVEGEITAFRGDSTETVTAGGTIVLPRGQEHALVAEEPSVVLVQNTPAGFGEFVTAVGEPVEDDTVPTPPPSDESIHRVRELGPEHGIEIVGPPPREH